jgi:hypothetical protein
VSAWRNAEMTREDIESHDKEMERDRTRRRYKEMMTEEMSGESVVPCDYVSKC